MNNLNIIAAENELNRLAKEKGVRGAIIEHLTNIAADLPDGKMPNGYTVEQAADEILKTTSVYTEARDAQITKDDLHTMIGKHCESMTGEQAAEYLAGIHVFYNNLGKPVKDSETDTYQEQIVGQIRNMAEKGDDVSIAEHVDALLESIDPEKMPSIFGFIHEAEESKSEGAAVAADAAFVGVQLNRHFDAQQHAIHAAAEYGEAVKGKIEGVSTDVNPGMVAATSAAAADAANVAMDAKAGKITPEAAEEKLNMIERAFMAALAGLWAGLYFAVGVYGSKMIMLLLTGAGIPAVLAGIIGLVCILVSADSMFKEFENAYSIFTSVYVWLREHTRPFRKKVGDHLRSAFQTGRNFIKNLGKA